MDLTTWLEFLKKTLEDLDATDRDLMVALWEGIWKQRIQAWLSKPVENPSKLFLQTTTNLRSFKRAQAKDIGRLRSESTRDRWEAPPPGVLKANTDTSIYEEEGATGIDIAIRNNKGAVLAAKSVRIEGAMEAHQVEAFTATEGIKFALELEI